jgi:flagellar basal-body rod protein FlgF
MTVALDIHLSNQRIFNKQLEVTTNNIANMSKSGFQEDNLLFRKFIGKKDSHEKFYYANAPVTFRRQEEGSFVRTDDPLHVHIQGDGYFAFQTPDGISYGRGGDFRLNEQRQLISSEGYPVLDSNNAPIIIPPNAQDITIGRDGTISHKGGLISQLGVFNWDDPDVPYKNNHGLLTSEQPPLPIPGNMIQFGYEGSNVNAIQATAELSQLFRTYGQIQHLMDQEFKTESSATGQLLVSIRT